MKFKKFISKALALGLIVNNFIIVSNSSDASSLEIPNRYETLEGDYITIDDSTVGELHEIEVFGNTVQDENNLEDIQSVGDLYVDEDGNPILDEQGREQYKIDIITTGKNLFNVNNEWAVCTYAGGWIQDEEPLHYIFVDNKVIVENQNIHHNVLGYKLRVFNNKSVSISIKDIGYTDRLYYSCYSKDWTYTKTQQIISPNKVGERVLYQIESNDIPDQTEYILLGIGNSNISNYEIEDIMIEYGEYTGSYTQHQSKNIELLLPTQLQKVGGVADKLYWDSSMNQYIIEKNIKKVVLDGTATWWDCKRDTDDTMYFQREPIDIIGTWDEPYLISDKLKAYDNIALLDNSNEGICTGSHGGVRIEIRILKSRLDSENVAGLISWLKSNPISVYYVTTQPDLFKVNITKKLIIPTYDEKTHIYTETENGIKPSLKITVDKRDRIIQDLVEKAEELPLEENISLARNMVNQLEESLFKDKLQEKLNSIFDSSITLERKTITSNLDLYVKSENMLSMSLDTNSITFDNYSGTEDIEKLSAVNITIDSSLPYMLNAYIPTEISNSDGSNKIDLSVFNIKESTEPTYQKFDDIVNKLVLKEVAVADNNKLHSIDLKLSSDNAYQADIYKTVIKFEAEQR